MSLVTMNTENEQSNKEKDKINSKSVGFEGLLDNYDYQLPKRGQILDGQILTIDEEVIILDVGLKRDAIVTSREVKNLDEEIIENLSPGDIIPIFVNRTPVGDENLLVSIDEALEYQSWEKAKNLLKEKDSVELKIVDDNKGGLLVQFDQLNGFVPNSHIPAIRSLRDRSKRKDVKKDMIGETLLVKPIEVRRGNNKLVFSALAAQKERRQERLQNLEEGSVISGKVVNVVDFGVFVDLDGVDGLIHVSELDWHRVEDPSDTVSNGDEIEVKIVSVDVGKERVELSRKALLPNPWEQIAQKYKPGDLVEVEITSVVDFGAFGELPEGMQGLIHASQLGYSSPASSLDTVEEGSTVLVKILNVDVERERVSLSMRKVPIEKQLDWMLQTEETPSEE